VAVQTEFKITETSQPFIANHKKGKNIKSGSPQKASGTEGDVVKAAWRERNYRQYGQGHQMQRRLAITVPCVQRLK
jgi:hypothetical protein